MSDDATITRATIDEEHRALVAYAETRPILLHLLWELGLMPAQVRPQEDRRRLHQVIGHFRLAAEAFDA